MRRGAFAGLAVAALLLLGAPMGAPVARAAIPQDPGAGETVPATPELIRQIQFMLQTVGIDPGPIDGNAQALTNRAAHQFELLNGLPIADITNNGPIPVALLEALRKQAAAKLGMAAPPPLAPAAAPPAAAPPAAPASTPAAPPPSVPPPPAAPDRFASCPYEPADFLVGGKQYTPQSFLDEGFGGSTDRAVTNLQQRLKEARDIAEKIGGSALLEVQRQARVLAYFECRQKIEQAAAGK